MDEATLAAERQLSDKDLTILNAELNRQQKSVGLAYVLWFFLAGLGVHQFYMGKPLRGVAYVLTAGLGGMLFWLGFIGAMAGDTDEAVQGGGMVSAVGFMLLAVGGVFVIYDLFTIPRQIRKREERLRGEILAKMAG